MAAKKFELFIGYLGNGATVCNKAVYQGGDYKYIAHISNGGNIKLYVDSDYIPAPDMEKIKSVATDHRKKTIDFLNKQLSDSKYHSFEQGFLYLFDQFFDYTPYNEAEGLFNSIRNSDREQQKAAIIDYYLKHF